MEGVSANAKRRPRKRSGPARSAAKGVYYDAETVKRSAHGRWIDIFTSPQVGNLDDRFLSGQHGPCPKCGGHDRFRLIDADEGVLYCNQCFSRHNGDGLSALQWLLGWEFPDVLRAVAEYLLVAPAEPARRSSQGSRARTNRHRHNADPAEHLAFSESPTLHPTFVAMFLKSKRPVTLAALESSGARKATYRGRHAVFALPIHGLELNAAPAVGWALYEATGGTLPVFRNRKIVDQVKTKLTYGSQEGLLGPDVPRLAQLQAAYGSIDRSTLANFDDARPEAFPAGRPTIWKTEGPSDAMSLWSAIPESDRDKHIVVANSNGAGQRLREFARLLAVSMGPVVIVADSDRPGLLGARRQAIEVAEAMNAIKPADMGGEPFVYVVQLPYEMEPDHGKDLRDYLSEGNTFADLLRRIAPGSAERATRANMKRWREEDETARKAGRVNERSPGNWGDSGISVLTSSQSDSPVEPLEADDDPHRLARLFLQQAAAAGRSVRYWRQQWYRWDGRAYRDISVDQMRAVLIRTTKAEFDRINLSQIAAFNAGGSSDEPPYVQKVSTRLISNLLEVLTSLCALGSQVDLNCWVDESGAPHPRPLISLDNGLLDVESVLSTSEDSPLESVLAPHSPQWFATSQLPYSFDPEAECRRWESFVAWAMDGDEERICLVQEWAGYLLLPDTSFQKFLVLEGDGSNGKSAFCAAMSALLGPENVSHVPLEKFGDRFALYDTIGKLANIIGDVGELEKTEEGFLKSFTSGDRMAFDRKHLSPVNAIPTARLMLSANNRPRFSDRSSGLWRRMMVVPFRATIAEDQKIRGMDKPKFWLESGELPGILNWALLGLERLRAQGGFTVPAISAEALEDYRMDSNPTAAFLAECYQLADDPDHFVSSDDVYAHYKRWCGQNGHHPLANRTFGKEVKRSFPNTEKLYKGPRGDRFWVHTGIKPQQEF